MRDRSRVEEWLKTVGLRKMRKTGRGFVACCHLNPNHEDRTPSMHVEVERGWVKCFGCGAFKPLFDFLLENGVEAWELLEWWVEGESGGDVAGRIGNKGGGYKSVEGPLPEEMLKRGFREETLRFFGVYYDEEKEAMGIPLVMGGELLGIQYRQWPKRFWVTEGFEKDTFVYNYDETEERLYVEGFTDCWRVWERGYKKVSALLQAIPSRGQIELMKRHKRVILAADNDEAGLRGMLAAYEALKNWVEVWYVPYKGKDPDVCEEEIWRKGLERMRPVSGLFAGIALRDKELWWRICSQKK